MEEVRRGAKYVRENKHVVGPVLQLPGGPEEA